jgi:hypothetical protein
MAVVVVRRNHNSCFRFSIVNLKTLLPKFADEYSRHQAHLILGPETGYLE